MAAIEELLDRQMKALGALGYQVALNPGAARAEIDALEDGLMLNLPDSVRALLSAVNGTSGPESATRGLFANEHLVYLDLSEIAESYRHLELVASEVASGWRPGYLPLLREYDDHFICVACTSPGARDWGKVVSLEFAEPPRVVGDSLVEWLTAKVELLELGARRGANYIVEVRWNFDEDDKRWMDQVEASRPGVGRRLIELMYGLALEHRTPARAREAVLIRMNQRTDEALARRYEEYRFQDELDDGE